MSSTGTVVEHQIAVKAVSSKIVSAQIGAQLEAAGIAKVMVVLERNAASAAALRTESPGNPSRAIAEQTASSLMKYFKVSEFSQWTALARAGLGLARTGLAAAAVTANAQAAAQHYPNLNIMLGTVDLEGLQTLASRDEVRAITGAPQISLIWPERVSAARLSAANTWGIDRLKAPALWKQGLSGKEIRVAHLDTGADGRHPALRKAIKSFAEFNEMGQRVTPDPAPHDSDEHGTHTAGTIAGRPVQNKSIGVAPGADLMSALVIEGGDVVARVLGGIDWAIGSGVRVLSMSLGFRGWFTDFIPIFQILREREILPVIAAGNEGPGTSRSPGNYDDVLSVGACDSNGQVPNFSSSQRFQRQQNSLVPDLIAPGVNVVSAKPGNSFQAMDGSSMATPHIAGLAALLFEAAPSATAEAVETAILKSCTLPSGVPVDRGNLGIPDATIALKLLTGIDITSAASAKLSRSSAKPRSRKKSKGSTKRGRK